MPTSVALGNHYEAFVRDQLQSGRFNNASEVVRAGLRLLEEREERKQLDGKNGLLIENATGTAARAGIRRGDVLLSVNGEPVSSVEQLRSLASKASKRVALLIQRDDARLFVPVDVE